MIESDTAQAHLQAVSRDAWTKLSDGEREGMRNNMKAAASRAFAACEAVLRKLLIV
jgi:hypothetical protein